MRKSESNAETMAKNYAISSNFKKNGSHCPVTIKKALTSCIISVYDLLY